MIMCYDNENSLIDIVDKIESFEIFSNGKSEFLSSNDINFIKIKNNLTKVFTQGFLVPAIGVSLHNETIKEMDNGNWLKINFINELVKNDLPFNSLLIKLEETQGFNLIRFHNEQYDGRCLYLMLNNEVDLMNLIKF